jgi:D-glycero-beta-D-manno-heptose-7-phosphate kinase
MTAKHFEQLLSNCNILIIGDIMLDSYIFGKVDRISPEAPVPVVSVSERDNRPGGAANVAINIKSMGATPFLCSVTGEDDKADIFKNLMKVHNMPQEGIISDSSRPTTTKFRVIGNNVQLLRVDEESTQPISSETTKKLCAKILQIINNNEIHCIIFQDYDKGVISKELIEFTTALATEKNIPVCVDPKRRNFYNYKNISLFKPNLKEFKEGRKEDLQSFELQNIGTAMQKFAQEQNIEHIMVTLSEKGVLMSGQTGNSIHIPAHVRQISDVSGAGDTVISIASLCMATGLTAEKTASLSNLGGGLVCQYVGVVPVDKDEFFKEATRLQLLDT